jgi:hypothetical protein
MLNIPIRVTYDNPPPPVRIISEGKTRYFLSLTQDEKCALYFTIPLLAVASQIKNPCLYVSTEECNAQSFDEYRSSKFASIPITQRQPYHEVISSLWNKTHELITAVYFDQSEKESRLIENYQKERELASQLSASLDLNRESGVLFSTTEYAMLASLHQHAGDCPQL